MSTIVTRAGKGSPLTNNEMDANLNNLNTDKAELSGATFTGAVVTPALSATSLNGWQLAGNRNKVVNGDFRVNQRTVSGTVTLAAGEFGHDRWKAGASGCTYTFSTISSNNGNVVLTITAGSLLQTLNQVDLHGPVGLVTDTFHTLRWGGTSQGRFNAGSYTASPITLALGTTETGGPHTIEFGTGTLYLVQVEPGILATPFEYIPYSENLARCQRDYFRQTISTAAAPYRGTAQSLSTTLARLNIPLPVTMRQVPTVLDVSATAGNWQLVQGGSVIALSAVPVLDSVSVDTVLLSCTVAAGLTAGFAGYLRNTSATTTYIGIGTGV